MQSSVFVGLAISLLVFACGSSDGPSASDAGPTGSSSSDGGSRGSEGGSSGGNPGSDAGGGGSSGYRCTLLPQGCDCQDPPPQDYTASSCPAYACCFTATGSFSDCTCLDEQDPQCSQQLAGKDVTRVDHCPP